MTVEQQWRCGRVWRGWMESRRRGEGIRQVVCVGEIWF